MKIERVNNNGVELKELKSGDLFEYDDIIYLLCLTEDYCITAETEEQLSTRLLNGKIPMAVNISSGIVGVFSWDDIVKKVDYKLTIN